MTQATVTSDARPQPRLEFIDMLRGLVLCLMVLDHTRDFVHRTAFIFDPLDLGKTSVALFMTRWVTHLCAPTFVFLSGVSIFLQVQKGKTGWPLSRFLLTRGLWLIVLELAIVNTGFDFGFGVYLQVIYAIGLSMVAMAALVWLPPRAVLVIGIAIIAGHNLFDGVNADSLSAGALPWRLLMQPGPVPGGVITYPALPWLGVMCLGYGLGWIYLLAPRTRNRVLAGLAAGFLIAFLILRPANLYGNVTAWTMPANRALMPLAEIDVTKYPPSLDYVLLTLGISFLLSLALQGLPRLLARPLLVFGRTAMLTYLLHIYLAHFLALDIGVAMGVPVGDFFYQLSDPSRLIKDGGGLPLWGVYAVWLSVLIILFPISMAYDRYKATHRTWWTSYL